MLAPEDKLKARPERTGHWTEAARRVLRERYLQRLGDDIAETPEDMLWRVASTLADTPERAVAYYDLMVSGDFLPNSPTLMNAGRDNGLQYSACYVLPVDDSMEGIFEAIKRAAIIHQSGGGTGFAFSRLRARDALVSTTGGRASGPVSFMRVFNAATEAVKQGGTRRGANMGILRVDHPDIEEFIDCKLDGSITNFNISVAATDAFMQAVEADGDYDIIDHHGQVVRQESARRIFDRMVAAAWRTGDPGLIFIDRINHSAANPTPDLVRIEATNPCGEQPLAPNEACNLGSLNVSRFVLDTSRDATPGGRIDWPRLERVVHGCVRFLDDVIEHNPYPLPEIHEMVKANRRIGLGVMGWADLLLELGMPYDSDAALSLAEQLMSFIERVSHEASALLAKERGAFPNFARSIYRDGPPLRNATVTTIAPTGSISLIAGCSSGIEPLFALAYSHVVGERHLSVVNPIVERIARREGWYSDALWRRLEETGGFEASDIPERWKRVLVTAHDVAPEWHVRMQAAFQKHTDNGVSKTVNMPADATVADVEKAYLLAWQSGCLGITVFRSGSKSEQVLHRGTGGATQPKVRPRPRKLDGATYRVESPLGTCFITVNHDPQGEPMEVFTTVGKAGSDIAAVAEAMGRLVSLILRLPSPRTPRQRVEDVVGQLGGIGGARQSGFGRHRIRSLPDAIAQVLAEYLGDEVSVDMVAGDLCPDCGHATLISEEGCQKCLSCGYTLC
jgi:ribonucleoside-diphosphate reductase alpha chain